MEIKEYQTYREDEIRRLYAAVGWSAYTDDMMALKKGFQNSLLVLAAYEGDDLIGILRAVGDGATIVFIQDILVDPWMQRRGVGTALVRSLMDRYASVRQIELLTDNTEKTKAFYRSVGFTAAEEIDCRAFIKM